MINSAALYAMNTLYLNLCSLFYHIARYKIKKIMHLLVVAFSLSAVSLRIPVCWYAPSWSIWRCFIFSSGFLISYDPFQQKRYQKIIFILKIRIDKNFFFKMKTKNSGTMHLLFQNFLFSFLGISFSFLNPNIY